MRTRQSTVHKRRLDRILREYNPGADKLKRLRDRYRTNEAIAKELETHMPEAQQSALKQLREFNQTIH